MAEHVLRLSRGLVERGWRVAAAVPPGSVIADPLAGAGVAVHRLPLARDPGPDDVRAARELRRLDRRVAPDIVHAHSSKAGGLVRAVLPGRGRLVYTPNCFPFAARFGAAKKLAYRAIEQALVPRTAAVVAVCDWERDLAERELVGAGSKTRVIPNGVERPTVDQPAPELVEFAAGGPLAGMVSVLREQKDPLTAVRAAAALPAEAGRFAVVGNGDMVEDVRREIDRLGAGDRVRWFAFEGGVGRYLAALDLFVLPSAWEAFPLAILEAMACGLAVVTTEVGGNAESVRDGVTGRVVGPGDADRLGAAMAELLLDPERRRAMGERGREDYEARYRVEPMVEAVEALYEELLGRAA